MHPGSVVILCAVSFFGGFVTDALLHKTLLREFTAILTGIHDKLQILVDKIGGK